jgi:UDP-GlcNAc3NAcA epimerase
MKKIVTVLGARPQFIKAAVVSRAVSSTNLKEIIVHTGQHFNKEMSDIFFEEMEIPRPDYMLDINSLSHGAMTGRMMEKVEEVLLNEKPDMVLVYGDTNSTLAGSLAASKLKIPVAHVEAGLRSFNMDMPEEINRILTDRISKYLFCPTDTAVNNLKKEGFENYLCQIFQVGDVMYDAALYYEKKSDLHSTIIPTLGLVPENYVLCTIHREENTDDLELLKSIFRSLEAINSHLTVVIPLHPRTQKVLKQAGIHPNLKLIDPVGYFDIIQLLKNSRLVITDSGGMQKEAFFFKKYCLTLRNETEWTELTAANVNYLVGSDFDSILNTFLKLKEKQLSGNENFYGKGNTGPIIVEELLRAVK